MKRLAIMLALVCAVAAASTIVVLVGCNRGGGARVRAPKAQAYICEDCGHKFGVPLTVPPKQRLFPPIVCPECQKQTAARAFLYTPKGGGDPVIYRYEKYTDKQIAAMEKYRDSTPEEQLITDDPESILVFEQDSAMMKYADDDKWFNPVKEPAKNRPFSELQNRFKSIIPVFPDDWPVEKIENLKQR